jgi:hypothetical protein
MRKIEKEMCAAIKARKECWQKDNTWVYCRGNRIIVRLHGNMIAEIRTDLKAVHYSHCGWPTVTTKSRLNAIANLLGTPGFCQRKGQWYFGFELFHGEGVAKIPAEGIPGMEATAIKVVPMTAEDVSIEDWQAWAERNGLAS